MAADIAVSRSFSVAKLEFWPGLEFVFRQYYKAIVFLQRVGLALLGNQGDAVIACFVGFERFYFYADADFIALLRDRHHVSECDLNRELVEIQMCRLQVNLGTVLLENIVIDFFDIATLGNLDRKSVV